MTLQICPVLTIMHLSIVCPTPPSWGICGGRVGICHTSCCKSPAPGATPACQIPYQPLISPPLPHLGVGEVFQLLQKLDHKTQLHKTKISRRQTALANKNFRNFTRIDPNTVCMEPQHACAALNPQFFFWCLLLIFFSTDSTPVVLSFT